MKRIRTLSAVCITIAVLSVGMNAFATEPAAGLPSPIRTYDSYEAAASAVGFVPLYMTKDSGYTCTYISTISNDVVDLGFQKLGQSDRTIRVRTAKARNDMGVEGISGIYGVTWQKKVIDGITVYVTQVDEQTVAAHWKQGNYNFSAQGTNLSYVEFMSLLENSLVYDTAHYFSAGKW